MATSVYTTRLIHGVANIVLQYDQDWPSFRVQPDPIEIEFIAGYGDAADVPTSIKEALMVRVTDKVENRQSTVLVPGAKISETIVAYRDLLHPYVVDLYA